MGKISKEKLEAMRSIGVIKSQTRHTDAGSIVKKVEEKRTDSGELVRETTDTGNNVITDHQDGRRDVELRPEPLHGKLATR